MQLYCGIDLHSNNCMVSVINDTDQLISEKRLDNNKAKFYFVHPFASWKRGLNENTNGLIRQYFPKKHDFTIITQKQIERVMDKLNHRHRKYLGIKTPNQVFVGIKYSVALAT